MRISAESEIDFFLQKLVPKHNFFIIFRKIYAQFFLKIFLQRINAIFFNIFKKNK
jgi:hypothetical protein